MASVELPQVDESDILQHFGNDADAMSEGHISLPSGSDGEADEAIVELPSVGCCSMECLTVIDQDMRLKSRVNELQQGLAQCNSRDKAKMQYDCMRLWQRQESGWRRFCVFDSEPCCQTALQKILQLTQRPYLKFCKALADGFLEPPEDMRQSQKQKSLGGSSDAAMAAHVLLTWTHDNIAEHLAESDAFVEAKKSLAGPSRSSMQLTETPKVLKYLPPGTTLIEMRDFAMSFNPEVQPPSMSTFSKVYHSDWQQWLKIRAEGQHSKCTDCEKLKAWRRQCHSKADRELVEQKLQEHIRSMKADRQLDATINLQAQLSAKGEMIDPKKTVLSLVIDGMDSAKFKIPRRLEATKEFSRLWRPECRFIGCLAEGLTENFFIGDCDLVKNASLDLTLVAHVIHRAQAELEQRGVMLPQTLRLHSDNASAELKNQLTYKFCSWLVHRDLFREVVVTTFRVGHSHGKIDQRFSECRSVLSESANLESPSDFLAALQKVKPREGRSLNLEEIHAAVDWEKYFEKLEVCVSGHTQTQQKSEAGLEAVHVFSFQYRKNLPTTTSKVTETFPKEQPHPRDVIMSCKHYMSSESDSQPPQVIAPHAYLSAFEADGPDGPTHISARRQLSERQVKEFTKTAHAVSQPPWNMHAASAYLLRLVTLSEEGGDDTCQPPSMTWVLRGARSDHPDPPHTTAVTREDLEWMDRRPAPVVAGPKPKPAPKQNKGKGKGMKRPAAAAAAPAAAIAPTAPEDEVSLPSEAEEQPENFASVPPTEPTDASAIHGAPPGAVVPPLPSNGNKKRKAPGWLPLPEGAREKIAARKHSKCRSKGCPECRKKIGLILNADETAWIWDPNFNQ